MSGLSHRLAFAVVAVAALLATAGAAQAQPYTVTNTSDSGVAGDGSLRGEVLAANASAGTDTIGFAPGLTGTISLSGSGLVISDPVDIEGPGPDQITVAQTSTRRVFDVDPTTPGAAVTIAGLHVSGGTAPNSGANEGLGGDILDTNADLTVLNDLITGGSANEGGGIEDLHGPLTLRSTTVSGNQATAYAGVVAGGVADFTVQASTISGNTSSGPDGGLYGQTEGTGLIEGSTISGNTATDEPGVNLNVVGSGSVVVRNSTLSGNGASDGGGSGLFIIADSAASVTIEDSTIAGNHANGGNGKGGGITLFGKKVKVENTIVVGNTASVAGPDVFGSPGSPLSSAFSLIGNPAGATITETVPGSDLLGIDPQLGPLQDNGGPTATMALPATSPAVNKGSSVLGTDQRGLARPVAFPGVANSAAPGADGADIGAFELQAPVPTPPSNRFGFGKITHNRKRGTATVLIKVPDAGVVRLAGNKRVKKAKKVATGAAGLKFVVRSRGRALKALGRKGVAKVTAKFTFTPTGGTPASKSKTLTLTKR